MDENRKGGGIRIRGEGNVIVSADLQTDNHPGTGILIEGKDTTVLRARASGYEKGFVVTEQATNTLATDIDVARHDAPPAVERWYKRWTREIAVSLIVAAVCAAFAAFWPF